MFTYQAYGLHIASDVALPLPPAAAAPPNLTLSLATPREVPHERPPGDRLAEIARPDHTIFYTLSRGTETILRYPALCDFVGDTNFEHITIHPHPGADEALLPVLISGALLAIHLMLRNELVLHASAVQVGDRALAFVGSSGMGKSTLATALCNKGYPLVSDDLLRVDAELLTYPGATETRLRQNATELAKGTTYETADGRTAAAAAELVSAPLPLAACVIPRPSRDITEVTTRKTGPTEALLRLSSHPRVLGWTDQKTMASTFQSLADLVERIPVHIATIPWGPPFAEGVLDRLVAATTGEPTNHVLAVIPS